MSSEPACVEPNLITVAAIREIKDARNWLEDSVSEFSHTLLRRHAEELRKQAHESPRPTIDPRLLWVILLGMAFWLGCLTIYAVNGFQAFGLLVSELAHEVRMR